jgi:subtilisin family serine protease
MKRLSSNSLIAVMAVAAIGIAVPGVQLLAGTPELQPYGGALHQERAADFARLKAKAEAEGEVHVIVQWNVPDYEALSAVSNAAANGRIAAESDADLAEAIGAVAEIELSKLDGISHRINRTFSTIPYTALTVSEDGLDALEASPGVLDINEDLLARPLLNNTVNITGASTAWNLGYDGTGLYVAVLDTGIRDTHEFFGGKDIVQACFARGEDGATGLGDCPNGLSSDTTSPHAAQHHATSPNSDHGTWTTGIATGNGPHNPEAGIAKGADIIAIQVRG